MSGLPWYPRYVGDFRKKTQQLTMLEKAAYNDLLDEYYATGKPLLFSNAGSNSQLIPDHCRLYRLCGAMNKSEQEAVDSVLKMFFTWDKNKGYVNKKAQETIEKQHSSHLRRVNAGKAGAAKKKGSNATSNAQAMLKQSEPEPEYKDSDVVNFSIERYLKDQDLQKIKKEFQGWDIQHFIFEYNEYIKKIKKRPNYPAAAFAGFIRNAVEGKKP